MFLDVISFMDSQNIRYELSGKNITYGSVGVYGCPFCGDRSTHLGIHLDTGGFSCWKCKSSGWAYKLFEAMLGVSRGQVKALMRPYFRNAPGGKWGIKEAPQSKPPLVVPPQVFDGYWPSAFLKYIESRGYDLSVIPRFGLKAGGYTGSYAYRIFIPIYINGILVSYQGRDITGQIDPKYKNCPNTLAIMPTRDCLYNIDNINKKVVIVEGITDVWRIGDSCVATLGTQWTNRQVALLKTKGVEEATLVFDGEYQANKKARELAAVLDMMGIASFQIKLEEGKDPGSLTEEEAHELRTEVFG